jgi:hypothetical protein
MATVSKAIGRMTSCSLKVGVELGKTCTGLTRAILREDLDFTGPKSSVYIDLPRTILFSPSPYTMVRPNLMEGFTRHNERRTYDEQPNF